MEGHARDESDPQVLEPDAETGALFNAEEFGPEVAEDAEENVFGKLQVADVYDSGAPLQLRRVRAKNILGFEDTEVTFRRSTSS